MTVRTAYDPVAGELLTAVKMEKLPGGWIGYAEVTTNQATITTEVDLTNLSVEVTVGETRRLRITGHAVLQRTNADGIAIGYIKEGASKLGRWAEVSTGAGLFDLTENSVVVTPSAGVHTYKLSLELNSGTGSVTMSASAGNAAFILVEDIGPAS